MAGLKTERLRIREVTLEDADFIKRLTNQPGWLKFIGDKKIHSLDDARNYISESIIASYKKNGFGIWLVELAGKAGSDWTPIGSCGLVNRDTITGVDLGFAFLQEAAGEGYAFEAAQEVLKYAKKTVELASVKAITLPSNDRSIKLLRKLQFAEQGSIELPNADNTEIESLLLFQRKL